MRRAPQSPVSLCTLLALLLLMVSCKPVGPGVVGNTLSVASYPSGSITANAPLALAGQGQLWATFETEYMNASPSGQISYALYASTMEGPVARHAHAMVVTLNSSNAWYFQPESSKEPHVLSFSKKEINGYTWTIQLMPVPAERDWFSALWQANGRETPERWLAQRYSATPDSGTRLVAEYREPWPPCLDEAEGNPLMVQRSCIGGFLDRANAAFTLDRVPADLENAPPAASALRVPELRMNTKKLVGELRREDPITPFRRW